MKTVDVSSWGEYAPPKRSVFLRALIKLGFGRGALRKLILRRWRAHFGDIVDVEVRGLKYRLNLGDNVTDSKIFGSSIIYDKAELEQLIEACKDGVFVDIGANTGYYTLALAKAAKCRVVAIEPNLVTLERLRFNVAINNDLKDRIDIVSYGVGEAGRFELHYGSSLGAASVKADMVTGAKKSVKIQIRPLLDVLREQNIDRVSAFKIDIEGLEDKALIPFFEDAPETLWPHCIVMEDTHRKMWETDLLKVLEEKGYREALKTPGNIILKRPL